MVVMENDLPRNHILDEKCRRREFPFLSVSVLGLILESVGWVPTYLTGAFWCIRSYEDVIRHGSISRMLDRLRICPVTLIHRLCKIVCIGSRPFL